MGMVFNMAGGPPLPLLTSPGAAGDLRAGKQLIDNNGDVLNGTLPEVAQATPTISVSAGGLITASANQAGGIVAAGSQSATDQLPTQAAKTVTPGTAQQTAVPAGVYTTGAVTVQGDANLVPENIAEGVSIFGVTGIFKGASTGIATGTIASDGSIVSPVQVAYFDGENAIRNSYSRGIYTISVAIGSLLVVSFSGGGNVTGNVTPSSGNPAVAGNNVIMAYVVNGNFNIGFY